MSMRQSTIIDICKFGRSAMANWQGAFSNPGTQGSGGGKFEVRQRSKTTQKIGTAL
jgi:hypothetical protein